MMLARKLFPLKQDANETEKPTHAAGHLEQGNELELGQGKVLRTNPALCPAAGPRLLQNGMKGPKPYRDE